MIGSYSQTGQDVLVQFMLRKFGVEADHKGRYVDVGAYHPTQLSNTYLFYKEGWRGVCVDPNPQTEAAFKESRPLDQFVRCAISEKDETAISYWSFQTAAHNTCDHATAEAYIARRPKALISVSETPVRSLDSLIAEHLPNERIDFCSIDTEGLELKVLKGMKLESVRPIMFIIESIRPPLKQAEAETHQLLSAKTYELVAHTGHDAFYIDKLYLRARKAK